MMQALAATDLIDQINAGRFMLLRQPIPPAHDLIDTESLSGICVRWIPEESGHTQSGTYLSALQETSLMHILDRWIIRCICHLIQTEKQLPWNQNLRKQYIIELSKESILDPKTAGYLHDSISQRRIPGGQLILETSFDLASENREPLEKLAKHARFLGCNLCLHGQPTPEQLLWAKKTLGVGYIKLDLSGCRNHIDPEDEWKKVTPIIKSSMRLGIKIIAQFVDSPRLIPHLQGLGVDYVQGWDLSLPDLIDTRLDTPFQ